VSRKLKGPRALSATAEGGTYAHPIIAGNRVFIKDGNSVTLHTIE